MIFVNPSDPFNIGGKQTQSKPDLGLGFSYFNEKLLLSLSVKNLTQPSFSFGIDDLKNTDNVNFSFLGKYLVEVDRDLNIEPRYHTFQDRGSGQSSDVFLMALNIVQ